MAIEFAGADTSNSSLTDVTTGSAGVKGSYVEFISSTARESSLITLSVANLTVDSNFEIFIAVGAVASEVDQFSISYWGNGEADFSYQTPAVTFPFTIASGARVSIACMSTDSSAVVECSVALSDDDSFGTSTEATLVGASGGQGTDVDPGGTANTKGSWTELVSSSPHDFDFLVICLGRSNNNVTNTRSKTLVDIGTGSAASEVVLVPNVMSVNTTAETGNVWYSIYAPIPSGTRIAARAQCTDIDATDRILDVSILGVKITAPSGGGVQSSSGFFS